MQIRPGLADIPVMIPPTDYPVCGDYLPANYRQINCRKAVTVTVESRELFVLIRFHRAFGDYLRDRHNPDTSARVLEEYHKVLQFYEQGEK